MRIQKFKKPNVKSILKSILLYYSVFLSSFLLVSGLVRAKSGAEAFGAVLFLPTVVLLWLLVFQKRRERKEADRISAQSKNKSIANHA